MKDYSWLAVFSLFTLVVGGLFTYGNGARAEPETPPLAVHIVSTSTPASPIIVHGSQPPITITLPAITITPPSITVNVSIATSSLSGTQQSSGAPAAPSATEGSSYTYFVTNNNYTTAQTGTTTDATAAIDTVTLTIQGVYEATTTPLAAGQTVLELLAALDATDPALALITQDYGDMGVLVTSMNGLENGTDGNYWQYTVNGVAPMIGADQYELEAEDTVVWEFKGF